MDLKRRLAELDRLTRKAGGAKGGRAKAGGDSGGPCGVPAAAPEERLRALGLVRRPTPAGDLWQRERIDDLPPPGMQAPDFSGFFPREGDLRPAAGDILFLDTETTGLSGGTGTLAFLVGVAHWRRDALVTRQFFLADPGGEPAILAALAGAAAGRRVVVTFNGTAFDLPLLRTRAVVNRVPFPLAGLAGWDLLSAGRRVWGRGVADCRQRTLEAALCGVRRPIDDIDGARIPQAWFDFLRGQGEEDVARVLDHNHADMVGMALLLRQLWRRAQTLRETASGDAAASWQEAWSLARICDAGGWRGPACRWIEEAVQGAAGAGRRAAGVQAGLRFWLEAVAIGKRAGRHDLVERTLHLALRRMPQEAALHREAAILYEHRLRRLDKALDHAVCSGERRRVARLRARLSGDGRAGSLRTRIPRGAGRRRREPA